MGRAHEVRAASMAKTAAAKTKVYSKYGKEILIAAKAGVPDPEMNLPLKRIIEKAKKAQVPADLIKRAIERAKSGGAEDYTPVVFEGFGPGASTLIVSCLTDNNNRTVSAVRSTLTKNGGKLGVGGSVLHSYNFVSIVCVKGVDEDTALMQLLDDGIDVTDVQHEEDCLYLYGDQSVCDEMKESLEKIEGIEIVSYERTYVPENDEYVTLNEEDKALFERLLSMLDECDDVQDVYHNVEL